MSTSPFYNISKFNSRRSPVFARNGLIASAQPLASAAGLRILLDGGDAVDAAVAAAAVLGVTEPYQTGLGGDAFALIYRADSGEVRALNASGPAPARARLEDYAARGLTAMPMQGPLSWTVPGCVDGWCQMLAAYGRKSLATVFASAIGYAEEGFPVAPGDADTWLKHERLLQDDPGSRRHLLLAGRSPQPGEVLRQPTLARTFRLIADGGRDAFYEGEIADRLVAYSERSGGLFGKGDLAKFRAEWQAPIGIDYRGHRILECPPNGQGIAALIALQAVRDIDFSILDRNSPECLHILIEATKHAMSEARRCVADPRFAHVPVASFLSNDSAWRASPAVAAPAARAPGPSDTVYLAVVDERGNAVSFINSIYGDFGSGCTVDELGFVLQNRGAGFSLDPAHPNCLAPGKRPYHTIIPAMAMRHGRPAFIFGMTGGFMQPQGHLQLMVSFLDYGMDVQGAIDLPRFWWEQDRRVVLEDGLPDETYETLARWGHKVERREGHRQFGGAQVIAVDPNSGVRIGGSEPRQDGCAIGY